MAKRGRNSPVLFTEPDDTIREIPTKPPQKAARQAIINSEESRSIVADAINAGRKAWLMPKVQSNQELIQRIDDYFSMVEKRKLPPTMEELSMYCGVASSTFRYWRSGQRIGFHDQPYPGCTTADICERATNTMHMIDCVMANTGKQNALLYIFRAKCLYNMVEKQEIVITPGNQQESMTPEQIAEFARNLPDTGIDESIIDNEGSLID